MTLASRPPVDVLRRPSAPGAGTVALVSPPGPLARELETAGMVLWRVTEPDAVTPVSWPDVVGASPVETLAYVAHCEREPDLTPRLSLARAAFSAFARSGTRSAVVVSSTAAYGATPHHPGLIGEDRTPAPLAQPIARAWLDLEAAAVATFGERRVTILRAAPTIVPSAGDYFSRLFTSAAAVTLVGYDPMLQILSLRDLVSAIRCALERRVAGIFNVVPAAPAPLRAALRTARCRPIAVPWSVQRPLRALLHGPARAASGDQVQFVRYHLTASPDKCARELGFVARDTTIDAIARARRRPGSDERRRQPSRTERFDPFGLDRRYIDACHRGFLGFLHRRYWRIETGGLDRIPRSGAAVLVGMHRGFMPLDGVMTLLTVVEGTGRVPRFLIHPGVGLRFPFLFNLMSKLGGVIACRENAERVLGSGELLAVYPEGIRGAFTMYRRAYRIGPSWRNDCIAFALRHGAPILPFVTIGSAEIFPILGRIDWAWWKKYAEWPFIPITPTFPLLPIPLPSKWHTLFLEPMPIQRDYSPDDADNPAVVKRIGADLRARMEAAAAELLSRRKSIFFGSLFEAVPS